MNGESRASRSIYRPHALQYDSICRLFSDPLTKCLRDRQANNMRKIVSQNPDGIPLKDLEQVICICDLALEAMMQDTDTSILLEPRLCDLISLLSNGFLTERNCEYEQYHDSVISYLKWIWKAASVRSAGCNRQMNICSFNGLRRFLNIDKAWQYPMPERFCQTLPDEFRRWRPMQLIAKSGVIDEIVKSVIDGSSNDPVQPLRALLLRDLSLSPTTAELLLSEHCHLVPALASLLQTNRREMTAALAIETIWNLLEQCNTLAAERLVNDLIVKSLMIILTGIFNSSSGLQDRYLRNQILCTLTFMSRVSSAGPVFVKTGLIKLLLEQSIEFELGHVRSTSFQIEEIEMKKLIWVTLSDLAQDPDCIEVYTHSRLIPALLVHTDTELGSSSLKMLIQVDRNSLALAAFQLLSVLVPKLHRTFQSENGLKRMGRFLRSGSNQVAELDRVAISVLLKACQTHSDCLEIMEDTCYIFTDSTRLSQVRSDLAVLLARCTSLVEGAAGILRRTGALAAAIDWIADVKSSVKLIASSLYIVKQGCVDHEQNLAFFVEKKGVELVMHLLLSSPSKELQRASMNFLDDLIVSSPAITKQLMDFCPETGRRSESNLIMALLGVWRSECNTIKSGCIHGASLSCCGHCDILPNGSDQPAITQAQMSTLSTLSRLIPKISLINPPTTPDDVFQVSMVMNLQWVIFSRMLIAPSEQIAMYDEIRTCNAWAECLRTYGPDGTKEQFLEVDLIPIRTRIEAMTELIESRIVEARSSALHARQVPI